MGIDYTAFTVNQTANNLVLSTLISSALGLIVEKVTVHNVTTAAAIAPDRSRNLRTDVIEENMLTEVSQGECGVFGCLFVCYFRA